MSADTALKRSTRGRLDLWPFPNLYTRRRKGSTAKTASSPATLAAVRRFWTVFPARTPSTLITVSTTSAAIAYGAKAKSPNGNGISSLA